MATQGSKACTACGETVPLSGFGRDKRRTDGRRSKCKECEKAKKDAPEPDAKALAAQVVTLQRELRTQGNRRRKTNEVLEAIQETVRECLAEEPITIHVPPRPKKRRGKKKKDVETAVLHVSDTQLGKRTRDYDTSVCRERIELLTQKTIDITNKRRASADIDECLLLLGGDMVEGEEIFPKQVWEIDSAVIDQAVRNGPRIIANMILALLEEFPKVRVSAVAGNHGRSGSKHNNTSPRTNWDMVLYLAVQLLLEGQVEEDRLEWNISDDWFSLDYVYGYGLLMTHGDVIRGQLGVPWYGYVKKVSGWVDNTVMEDPWHFLYTGHFHQAFHWNYNGRGIYCNGTTESSNVYAASQLAASGFPCQRLQFFAPNVGVACDYLVYLDPDTRNKIMKVQR